MSTLLEYKCPCCGGEITFDSDLQKMKCPYCDTEFEMEALASYDNVLKEAIDDDMQWEMDTSNRFDEGENENFRVYSCRSCGGEIVADVNTAASRCPYCDNPIIMTGQLSGALKPDYVIPFKQDKKAAIEALKKHYGNKRFLPQAFKDQNHIEEVKGIYVPFWLFDTDAEAQIRYKASKTRFWSDNRYNYTETSFYSVVRGGKVSFENVPVDGSSKIDDALMESLEPYRFSDALDFQSAYLSGYLADKYDVDSEKSIERANERIKKSTEETFASSVVGYDTVIAENTALQLKNGHAKYALYPVWILNTTWNGEKYTFAMNGQTGKFAGDLPVDKAAARRFQLALTGIITAACFAVSWIMWLL